MGTQKDQGEEGEGAGGCEIAWRGAGKPGAEGKGREDTSAVRITLRRNCERYVAGKKLVNIKNMQVIASQRNAHAGKCKPM